MKPLNKFYYILSFGVLLNVSAYVGILTLQSSIHLVGNIGTTSAGVLYITAAILSICLTPLLLLQVGAKWSLIIGEIGFVIYTISNFRPTLGSLICGAIFGALGEALIWPAAPVYINYLLKQLWRERSQDESRKYKSLENERNLWLGSFYGILQNCLVWGNFISYVALYGARNLNVNTALKNSVPNDNISTCGANFSLETLKESVQGSAFEGIVGLQDDVNESQPQDQSMKVLALSKYVPSSSSSVYIMLTLFLGLQLAAVGIHTVFLPVVGRNDPGTESISKRSKDVVLETLKLTIQHVNSYNQIMLIFINFYFGLLLSYSRGVFSQAFASCSLGVQMVGLVMMIYGCTNAIMALVSGQIASRYGVKPLVIFGFFFDMMQYVLQLKWKPTYESRFYVLGFGALLGISEGIWQFAVISMTALYFEERQEIAFGAINLWCELAVFIGFILTPILHVEVRIYVMMGSLILGCIGYAAVDSKSRRRSLTEPTPRHLDEMLFELAPKSDYRPAPPPPTPVDDTN